MKPKVRSEISLLSMRASAEGMVLLRNMDMLPFKKAILSLYLEERSFHITKAVQALEEWSIQYTQPIFWMR